MHFIAAGPLKVNKSVHSSVATHTKTPFAFSFDYCVHVHIPPKATEHPQPAVHQLCPVYDWQKGAYLRSTVVSWGAETVRLARCGQVPRHRVVTPTCRRVTCMESSRPDTRWKDIRYQESRQAGKG